MKQEDINTILGESQILNPEKWENKMKPQFTEEEAIGFLQDIFETADDDFPEAIKTMRILGYIRKSDLEILIEEAEEMWNKYKDSILEDDCIADGIMIKQNACIQAMKVEIERLKK